MIGVIISNSRWENLSEGHLARETFINKQQNNPKNKQTNKRKGGEEDNFGSVEVRPKIFFI